MKTRALGILKGRNPKHAEPIQAARIRIDSFAPERAPNNAISPNVTIPVDSSLLYRITPSCG